MLGVLLGRTPQHRPGIRDHFVRSGPVAAEVEQSRFRWVQIRHSFAVLRLEDLHDFGESLEVLEASRLAPDLTIVDRQDPVPLAFIAPLIGVFSSRRLLVPGDREALQIQLRQLVGD